MSSSESDPRGRVLGVDVSRAKWIGVALDGEKVTAYAEAGIADLVEAALKDGPLSVIAIDIPIGLPDRSRRRADELAHEKVGSRRSSVFLTPVRAAVEAETHRAAIEINRRLTGAGVSAQAFALRSKILEVDRWIRDRGSAGVVEVHPEVSFAELAGAPLDDSKSTWAGVLRRRKLLAVAGINLPDDLGPAGRIAAVDDVLDAAAAAWTACRVAAGNAESYPADPEQFTDGLAAAIWM